MFCPHCGAPNLETNAKFCGSCGKALLQENNPLTVPNPNKNTAPGNMMTDSEYEVKRIADYQKISNIIWLVIGILQVCSVYLIIAGVWNIIATCTNWKLPRKILNKDADIPEHYESIAGLIVFLVINLLVGGVLGVLFVIFDFYIRSLVLQNRNLFTTAVAEA